MNQQNKKKITQSKNLKKYIYNIKKNPRYALKVFLTHNMLQLEYIQIIFLFI